MRRLLALGLPLALLAGMAGCGDGEGPSATQQREERSVEAVAERLRQALAARDSEDFCRLLAPEDRYRLRVQGVRGMKACLQVWGPRRNPLFGAELSGMRVERVALEGTYATATLANGGRLAFAKEGKRWYVHLSPGGDRSGGAAG